MLKGSHKQRVYPNPQKRTQTRTMIPPHLPNLNVGRFTKQSQGLSSSSLSSLSSSLQAQTGQVLSKRSFTENTSTKNMIKRQKIHHGPHPNNLKKSKIKTKGKTINTNTINNTDDNGAVPLSALNFLAALNAKAPQTRSSVTKPISTLTQTSSTASSSPKDANNSRSATTKRNKTSITFDTSEEEEHDDDNEEDEDEDEDDEYVKDDSSSDKNNEWNQTDMKKRSKSIKANKKTETQPMTRRRRSTSMAPSYTSKSPTIKPKPKPKPKTKAKPKPSNKSSMNESFINDPNSPSSNATIKNSVKNSSPTNS